MTVQTERPRAGAHIVSEANGTLSREAIIVNATAGRLNAGTVISKLTAANAGTATAAGGNTGTGTITGLTVGNDAITGTYSLEVTVAAEGAGTFELLDPFGNLIAGGTVGVPFDAGGLSFTLGAGSPDFIVGDAFSIAVTAGLGEWVAYDGMLDAGGILYAEAYATEQDANAVAHVRHAEVVGAELTGLDDGAVEDLRALQIIVR